MKDYTQKRLAEFDEKFPCIETECDKYLKEMTNTIALVFLNMHWEVEQKMGSSRSTSLDEVSELLAKTFVAHLDKYIKEAEQEMIKRVENTPYPILPDINKVKNEALLKNNTVDYSLGFLHGVKAMRYTILSSLSKPSTDNK